jgi:hypothetical protein
MLGGVIPETLSNTMPSCPSPLPAPNVPVDVGNFEGRAADAHPADGAREFAEVATEAEATAQLRAPS